MPKIGSFYGVVTWILHLEKSKSFSRFIETRKDFEWVIWQDDMVPQIVRKSSAVKAREKVKDFYQKIIEKLFQEVDKKKVIKEIIDEKVFGSLKRTTRGNTSEAKSKSFSRETKAAAYIREALPGTPRCKICGGYIPSRINTIDHKIRKEDGGLGTLNNAQLTHPYCNTTFKN